MSQIFLEPYQGEDPVCTKCIDERKNKKVIGMNFLWGFMQEGDSWTSGQILDPETGEVYTANTWLTDVNTMQVRGYAGLLNLFYRTQIWKRENNSTGTSPVGRWHTIDDRWNQSKSIVEIRPEGRELKGYIRKIFVLPHEGTDPICMECKDKLKNAKVIGMTMLWDFRKEGEKWVDEKILDPGNGNVYSSSMWLVDKNTLKVRGYLGPFFRSQVWKRVP